MATYREEARDLPVRGDYDVIVAGGGAAGFMAAVAAARAGARTLLIERYGFLGGTATAAMMVEFGSIHDGQRVLVGGVAHEFMHRLAEHGGATIHDPAHNMIFDPESMIAVCQQMAIEAGVELLLHTWIAAPLCKGGRVRGVIIESKSGRQVVLGKVVVDCTGDGDLAARAGAANRMGRDGDGALQPVTLEVLVGNVDLRRTPPWTGLKSEIDEARRRGEWTIPTERFFSWGHVRKRGAPDNPASGFYFLNVTNSIGIDGTDVAALTRAEIETRSQLDSLIAFLRKYVPGFADCYLDRTAAQVGIRETRRIEGHYTLTRQDVLEARHFDDGVVPACNSIDVHEVKGKDFAHEYLRQGTHYQIPYRCLLPQGLEGMLVAGRCLSADWAALGSARVMVVCMPMGEAAGLAAAQACRIGCMPHEIDVGLLREQIRCGGTILE